jgi:alkylated DNA repair protein (DNA oxidative demethylase)
MEKSAFKIQCGLPAGVVLVRRLLPPERQIQILESIQGVLSESPPYRPRMPRGRTMTNRISNCGPWGWTSDEMGYRYCNLHPLTCKPWPSIPGSVSACVREVCSLLGIDAFEPDACLINMYADGGKLGLHRDNDELDFCWPIVSISLGNTARFVIGGVRRQDRTIATQLHSGDVMVLHHCGRMLYHGVSRVIAGTSPVDHPVLSLGGRINLTIRRAR